MFHTARKYLFLGATICLFLTITSVNIHTIFAKEFFLSSPNINFSETNSMFNKFSGDKPLPQASCQIDFVTEVDTCLQLDEIISYYSGTNQEAVFQINMHPSNGYDQLRIELDYGSDPSEWSLNLGDSATNSGWGGDAGTNSRDAELQIYNTRLNLYGSDYVNPAETLDGNLYLATQPNFVSVGDTLSFIVRNQYVEWTNLTTGVGDSYASSSIFALNGQSDFEGISNYDLYLGINRTINSSLRDGSGVERVRIILEESNDSQYIASGYVLEDTDEDGIGDTPVEGVQLWLMEDDAIYDETFTNASGYYDLTANTPGFYTIYQFQPNGFVSLGETDGGDDMDHPNDGIENNIPLTFASGPDSIDTGNNFIEQRVKPTSIHLSSLSVPSSLSLVSWISLGMLMLLCITFWINRKAK